MGKNRVTTRQHGTVKLRQKQLANGDRSLYLDIYHKKKRSTITLGIYLTGSRIEDAELLRQAEALRAQKELDLLSKKTGIIPKHAGNKSFIQFAEEMAGKKKYHYWTRVVDRLKEYDAGATMADVDDDWCNAFGEFLLESRMKNGKPLGANTAATHFGCFRTMVREATRAGHIDRAVLDGVRPLSEQDVEHTWLTIDELRRLAAVETKSPESIRAFIFSCYTGLRDSDIRNLTWGKISPTGDGGLGVPLRQKKTGNVQYLPLSKQARKIIGGKPRAARSGDRVFHPPGLPQCNAALKVAARRASIDKNLSMHVGRHTFAVLFLSNGGDLYVLKELLGHTDIESTQVYADIVNERLHEGVEFIPPLEAVPLELPETTEPQ